MDLRAELIAATVVRGERPVLREVSFGVPAAGVTAMVGPSGSGKSTVLRCLVRLQDVDDGTVLIDGTDVRAWDAQALRRHVALVAQAPVMLPSTVADNLAYAMPALPSQAEQLAALVEAGLGEAFLDRRAGALSGGEAMRVAIARALVRRPALLLLDEPTAALDVSAASALERSLAQLAARGSALLMVTHDEDLARRLATHVVRLDRGQVSASGSPERVLVP